MPNYCDQFLQYDERCCSKILWTFINKDISKIVFKNDRNSLQIFFHLTELVD